MTSRQGGEGDGERGRSGEGEGDGSLEAFIMVCNGGSRPIALR